MCDMWMDVDVDLAEVPVNVMPLLDSTDYKTIKDSVAYDAAGMVITWNFVTTAGAYTQTAVTPTTGDAYDWASQGNGMYSIEIPATGGASINNDTEGFGWFTGVATGVLPWRGPVIGFRAVAINNALIDGGDTLDVNVTEISGDVTAADNTESAFDGTGYGFTACTMPTTTTVTNSVSADVTKISGDSDAADKLEAMLDATESAAVDDESASTSAFITTLTEATDGHYVGGVVLFTSGALIKQARRISVYAGDTKAITVTPALTEAPGNGDTFLILGRIEV